jgi:hypothetical protein
LAQIGWNTKTLEMTIHDTVLFEQMLKSVLRKCTVPTGRVVSHIDQCFDTIKAKLPEEPFRIKSGVSCCKKRLFAHRLPLAVGHIHTLLQCLFVDDSLNLNQMVLNKKCSR